LANFQPIIDANNVGSNKAVCYCLWLPDWQETADPVHVQMTGGVLEITKDFVIGRTNLNGEKAWVDTGILTLNGGTITIGQKLSVGGKGNDWGCNVGGHGTIDMTGGLIDCNFLLIPEGNDTTVTGCVNLDGGIIDTNNFVMKPRGSMYITGGKLKVLGNKVATINGYITASQIMAGDASHTLRVSYDAGTNTTTLAGISVDLSNDGTVNYKDLKMMLVSWLATGTNNADIDGDGKVDFKDFAKLAARWLNAP
jgi:hypothetical protein